MEKSNLVGCVCRLLFFLLFLNTNGGVQHSGVRVPGTELSLQTLDANSAYWLSKLRFLSTVRIVTPGGISILSDRALNIHSFFCLL